MVAGIGMAIALVSQTYQFHGTFANFHSRVDAAWPSDCLSDGARRWARAAYLIGAFCWLF